MRALAAAAAMALLLLPGLAAAHADDRQLTVEAGYPLPHDVLVGVAENEGCWTHDAFWSGWDLGADPLNQAYEGQPGGAMEALLEDGAALLGILGGKAADVAADGLVQAPSWAEDPFAPPLWAYHHFEDADACVITTLRVAVDGQGLY